MPDNGSGVYTVPSGSAATANTTIESSVYNALLDDLASALSSRINADGQKPYAANQPMASHKFTGLAAGSAAGDSVRYEQSPDGIVTTRGDILVRGASAVSRLALGTTGQVLASDGTNAVWGQANTAGIANGAVTLAKMDDLAQNKIIGRTTASTGVPEAVGLATGLAMSGGNLALQQATTSAIGGAETATDTEAKAKSSTSVVLTPSNLAGMMFESSEISITLSEKSTVAHGLGVKPKRVEAFLRCKTAEYGFSAGEEVPAPYITISGSTSPNGVQVSIIDSTGLRYIVGGPSYLYVGSPSGSAYQTITPASWRIVIRAWA